MSRVLRVLLGDSVKVKDVEGLWEEDVKKGGSMFFIFCILIFKLIKRN